MAAIVSGDSAASLGRRPEITRNFGTLQTAAFFLLPSLAIFTIFVVMPMMEAGWYSFFSWNGLNRPNNFVGFGNYIEAIREPGFRMALLNVFWIIAASLFVQIPLGLVMSLILVGKLPGAVFFRLIFFLPYVLAQTATGLMFTFVYDGNYGLVKSLFDLFGVASPHILANENTAMPAVLFVVVWKYFGFHMMLLIAGLQSLDNQVMEAAEIDGASRWQTTRFIVLPMLMPTIKLCVFFSVLGSLQFFDLIMPLTGGGPLNATQTLVTYLYNFGMVRLRIGYGSAVGVILFLMCLTFAFSYKRWVMRNE